MSTSLYESTAFSESIIIALEIPQKTNAAYVGLISEFENELEMLVDKNAMYRIKDIVKKDGNVYIKARVEG